ncbi:MAG: response regulator transcription factor [Alphaproteobacteria bacterium]
MDKVTQKRLLIVDDDKVLADSLVEQLDLHQEFNSSAVYSGKEGLEAAQASDYDCLILDVDMPDMDGRDLCKLLRRQGLKMPILMLTGQDSDADTILGLDAGANDYVTKPFRLNVLLARIRAQLRTHELSDDATFPVGPYNFRPSLKMLQFKDSDRKIKLTEKETSILKFLYRAGGKTVSREDLLGEVWGYNSAVNTHTLETHIYRLRQKIEESPRESAIVITDPGGYRLGN